jgi:hypothetical protein
MLSSLLSGLFKADRARTPARTARPFAPRLESLDGRLVPAVTSISQNLSTGVAVISADGGADAIAVTDLGTGGVIVTGTGLSQAATLDPGIRTVRVNTAGGNDTVTYNLTNTFRRDLRLEVNLGTGGDTFRANLNGFNVANSSDLDLDVTGGSGGDVIRVDADGVDGNRVNIGAGSRLILDLQAGSDLDLFDAADVIDVDYRGVADGDLVLRAVGGLGNDNINAVVTLDAGSDGRVLGFGGGRALVSGGLGADALDFRVRDRSGGTAGVSAAVDGGFLDFATDAARHTANVVAQNLSGGEDIVVT